MNGQDTKEIIDKAQKFLESSRELVKIKDFDSSVSRTYYAMYSAVEAVLLSKGFKFKSHKAIISGFGKYFIKLNEFPKEMGRQLSLIFEKRQIGDYGHKISINQKETEEILEIGQNFVNKIIEYLNQKKII